mgnify:FL=1
MRTFRILAALMMAVVCVSLSSCSDDDENDKPVIEEANLIGKWQSTWEKIHTVENGKEVVISDEAYTDGSWEFKADGTCIENGNTTSAHWTLKDDKLTISYNEGFDDDYTVKELTANKLVLVFEDWDNTDDGGEVLDDATTTTYKKIN